MIMHDKFLWLTGGVVTLLLIASITGWLLGLRVKTGSGRAVIDNLKARVRAWWVMVAIFAVASLLGKLATIIMFSFISFFTLREFLTLTPTRASDHRALSLAFFIFIPVQYYLIGLEWYALFSIFIPVYGFLLLPSLSALNQDPEHFLERCAKIQWGVMLTIYCISHVPALLLLDIPGYTGQNALLLFYLLLVVQMSDVLQYVFGKIFGKTKIAPVVSPSKTVEGFIGGGVGATLIGASMWWITPFTLLQAAGMAFVTVLMGFLGGLVLSAVKRSLGAKDWGTMIEGHGGMMDRMDSVSFAAPIFFHLTRYFFAV
ncbi:MAG TPA: phosphatidate cytidylyltransferase [Candidatus Competibacteraceae bacterium]|nr:phosphatidate cytidylyltransferase [Candidatus Competibacteraceae bacterium]HPF60120.1 phosphatidate cytidylyltransferase [Candidatus Competibacteraceae bacterium]HRY19599.1 phosphatidate cytidylyltransferase [Candidatus Competibacteraceae bacterium]